MKIALLGATRGTGKQVLQQALGRGHEVTALARDVSKLPEQERLTRVTGDATNADDVARAVKGCDVVVSSLGAAQLSSTERTVSRGASATVDAMKREGVKRLIFVSVLGAGDQPRVFRVLLGAGRVVARGVVDNVIDDKNRAEQIIRDAGVQYTFVRAPGMTDDAPRGYEVKTDTTAGWGKVSRADLAAFIVDECEQAKYVNTAPAVFGRA